nr:hypothetical protein [Tanacetum cinerariifolium]
MNQVVLGYDKVKTVNEEEQIQALVDKKMVIIRETSVRSDLHLKDAKVFLDSQVECMLKHKEIYVTPSDNKKIFANMKRQGKDFFGKVIPLFENMMVQPQEDIDEDRLKLTKVMELCTKLLSRVLTLETIQANQALEIRSLKTRVTKLEKKASKKTYKLKRLYKIGSSTRVESSKDAGLGDQEDTSKQGMMIDDLDADEGVTLVDETQGKNDQDMFDTSILDDEVIVKKEISTADPVPTASEVVTTADIKTSKLKAKGIVMQEPHKTPTPTPINSSQQSSKAKDKGKAKMIEPQKPLKRKYQIMIDEEVFRNLEAQMQVKLEEEERLARQREKEANIALIESCDNIQAMMDVDYELATRLQEEERGELTIEEKSRLFMELMDKRKKYFARLRAEKIRSKPPTKTQKRFQMCTYLKNMANYKHNQLKNKSFEEIQMLFNNTMKWIESFVPMDTELVKGSKKEPKGSSKRARGKLEQEDAKRQRIEEENESAELKRCLEIIPDNDDDVKIKATSLSSKSRTIVD